MNTQLKYLFFFLLVITLNIAKAGKDFEFAYDGNGNRITITIVNDCQSARVAKTDTIMLLDSLVRERKSSFLEQPKIFPNPVHDYFTIDFSQNNQIENATISIYNLNGNLMMQETGIYTNQTKVGICDYANGIYIVRVDYGAEKPFVQKIQKY